MGCSSEAFQLDMFPSPIPSSKTEAVEKAPLSVDATVFSRVPETSNVIQINASRSDATANQVKTEEPKKTEVTKVRRTRVSAARRTVISPQARRANQAAAEGEIAAFLAKNGASKCPTRWATGAVPGHDFNIDI